MRFSIAIVAAFAGIVSAATTTTTAAVSTASCAAQNIVEACLGSTQPILDSCTPNDWKCMCAAQESVSTCYDNCPGDTLRVTANQKKDVYCQAAKAESSRSVAASGTPTVKSTFSAAASTTAAGTGSLASAASAAASSTKTAAANVLAPAASLLAVAVGVAGLL